MVLQPLTVHNSCFYSLILYIWLYFQDRLVSQTGYNIDIHVLYQTTDRVMSFISGYDIDIQVRLTYTRVRQKQVAHSHKQLKLSGATQSYSVILSIDSATPELSDTLFTGTISKYSSFQSSYINSVLHFDSRHFHTFHHHHRSFVTPS